MPSSHCCSNERPHHHQHPSTAPCRLHEGTHTRPCHRINTAAIFFSMSPKALLHTFHHHSAARCCHHTAPLLELLNMKVNSHGFNPLHWALSTRGWSSLRPPFHLGVYINENVVVLQAELLTCPIHSPADRLLMTVPPGFSIPSCHLPLCRPTTKQNRSLLKTEQTCHETGFSQILGQRTAVTVQANLVILPLAP